MAERKKRKIEEEAAPTSGITHGTGIHRQLDIDEDFERGVQAERGLGALKTKTEKKHDKRLIVVLENANLELVKNGKHVELLNSDKHKNILKKHNRELGSARPDITHQTLLCLMDSPLNRAQLLQVYVRTTKNVLIEINPQTRIPRTFDRFCGLMVNLLEKFSIRAGDAPIKLLKVIKNPVTDYLPPGCKKTLLTFKADAVVRPDAIAKKADEGPHCIVIGAMAHGKVDINWQEDECSISNYPLSAALCAAKVCHAFEEEWGVH